jgi:SAM-dependent methyltransferase
MTGQPANQQPWYREAFRGDYLDLYTHRNDAEAAQIADLIARMTQLPPGATVADVPCGGGRHLRAFAARQWCPVGMDLSPDLLRAARRDGAPPADRVVLGDIRAVPFASQRFDLVANLFTSLGYFDDDANNAHALAELARLVAPGGWLVVDFLDSDWVRANLRPYTERTTPAGLRVEEIRQIAPADPTVGQSVDRVVKQVRIHRHDGTIIEHFERVALLDRLWFQTRIERLGLTIRAAHGDYAGRLPAGAGEATRLILIAQKP